MRKLGLIIFVLACTLTAARAEYPDHALRLIVPQAATPFAKAGNVRALAVTADHRSPAFPDLPTVAEAGVPGYAAATWTGVIAPAGVPRRIVDKLNAAINKAMTSDAFKKKFAKTGDEPGGGTPEDFAQAIKTDSAKWGDLIRRAGIKMQ